MYKSTKSRIVINKPSDPLASEIAQRRAERLQLLNDTRGLPRSETTVRANMRQIALLRLIEEAQS